MKILNLYAGIGGNRKLWKGDIQVTAVEDNIDIFSIYRDNFPEDRLILDDAHEYLLGHYKEFDFIWSSPPCPSHGRSRYWGSKTDKKQVNYPSPIYPDMSLYQEIIFLKHFFKGKWIVENVNPYYTPLIPAKCIQRHLFWSNFDVSDKEFNGEKIRTAQIPQLQEMHGFDLSKYKLKNKRQILRNCVLPQLGLHILNCAFKIKQKTLNGG